MNTLKNEQWLNLYKNQTSILEDKIKKSDNISTYFFIFDYVEESILFVNSAFSKITGYNIDQFDINLLINIIYKDDLNYFLDKEAQVLQFANKLTYDDHFRYTNMYSYRITKSDGSIIRILQESQALEVNENGHLSKNLIIHRVINEDHFCKQTDHKIFDKTQSIYLDLNNNFNLTNRELEVLTLIKQGQTSKQIAETLHVSYNTILTHRKNILCKTNSNSFIELVKKISSAEY